MSKSQTLRALVNERLAAAAEEIFVLIERTIVEYEEELCRSREENLRKQELLDQEPYRANVQMPSVSPGPDLNQEMTETPQIKEEPEEQIVKQEEEQLPVSVPESSAVCVTTESSPLQQRQTEHREETQGEDVSSETHFHFETEGHNDSSETDDDDDWGPFTRMERDAVRDRDNQVQIADGSTKLSPQNTSAPETTVHSGHASGADADERKKHLCHVCNKRFGTKQQLQAHLRVHTGEKPFSCSICKKTFTQKSSLNLHTRTHTGDKPYSCSFCSKTFALKFTLDIHTRTHTGEKPYSCSVCLQRFTQPSHLRSHNRMHTGERPYSCTVCEKTFTRKNNLRSHMSSTHTT